MNNGYFLFLQDWYKPHVKQSNPVSVFCIDSLIFLGNNKNQLHSTLSHVYLVQSSVSDIWWSNVVVLTYSTNIIVKLRVNLLLHSELFFWNNGITCGIFVVLSIISHVSIGEDSPSSCISLIVKSTSIGCRCVLWCNK